MKPSRFEYRSPETPDEAIALLAADPNAKVLAGGQSLMPVLAFRLAAPACRSICTGCPGGGHRRRTRAAGRRGFPTCPWEIARAGPALPVLPVLSGRDQASATPSIAISDPLTGADGHERTM